MNKLLIAILLLFALAEPAGALEFTAPNPPASGAELFPQETQDFGRGLGELISGATEHIQPAMVEAAGVCVSLIAVVLLLSVCDMIGKETKPVSRLIGVIAVSALLLHTSNSFIHLGTQTVLDLCEYGKLLAPVMASAAAAQGAAASSAAIYGGTVLFISVMATLLGNVINPVVYTYLCLACISGATENSLAGKLKAFAKWVLTWSLKLVMYCFIGYISITGVVSGTADAMALKAAKLTISGMVPVVGGILSDASEAVLVGAGVMKNGAGIYGMLAILSVCILPFLQIGIQYWMLKATGAVCEGIGAKAVSGVIKDFSSAMGIILATTGSVCLMLLISTVCFMKGVGQ